MSAITAVNHLILALAAAELPACAEGCKTAGDEMTAASWPFRVGYMQSEIEKALKELGVTAPVRLPKVLVRANDHA